MDHGKIKKDGIIENYILGKLPKEEAEAFEVHYFGCDTCFAAVQEAEKVIYGIKDAAKRGILIAPEVERKPFKLLDWLESFTLNPAFAVAAIVGVLALIYPAWRGAVTVPRLQSEIEELRQPQANAPSFFLLPTRDQGVEIPVKYGEETFLLNFNILESTVQTPQFRAEIVDQAGKAIWKTEALKSAGQYETFSIVCRSSFFNEGNYDLKVYGINPQDGKTVSEFSFPFKIVFVNENVEK